MITATVDVTDVERGMAELLKSGRNLRTVFSALTKDLKADIKQHFEQREGPFGAWAPYASSTFEKMLSRGGRRRNVYKQKGPYDPVRLRKRARRRVGNLLGHLKTATKYTAGRDYLEGRSRVAWSSVHDDGEGKMPARPFLWISDRMQETARVSILNHVTGAFG